MSPLATRVATAVVLLPAVLVALFATSSTGWGFGVLVVLALAAREWALLTGFRDGGASVYAAAIALTCLLLLFLPAFGFAAGWPAPVVIVACGAATLFWLAVATPSVLRRWPPGSRTRLALIGAVILLGAFVALVELQARSPWHVLGAMAIVWIADTAAYFAGRAFGRRKLAPLVSPGKSWEGVWGGLAAVAAYALALVPVARAAGYDGPGGVLAVLLWIALALLLAALSVVGDLYESWLKRCAGVKDSGALLPGHGGVLDRTDALLAAMPPAALAAHFLLRA